jgi:4-hydroxy-3-polyprenylbenzoate decarboxylase
VTALHGVGELLSQLKEPEPPKGMKDAIDKIPVFKNVLNMAPKVVKNPPCQEINLHLKPLKQDTADPDFYLAIL